MTPGLESPTIAPLTDPNWVVVRVLVPGKGVNAIIDEQAGIGSKAILASDNQVLPLLRGSGASVLARRMPWFCCSLCSSVWSPACRQSAHPR